jgi:hypothetical protein
MDKPARDLQVEALLCELQRYLALLEALRAARQRESGEGGKPK